MSRPPVARAGAGLLRWRSLAGGAGMMFCIGTAYSWSLFTRPLMVLFAWTSLQVSFAFALMIFGIGIGAFAGGLMVDRFGARNIGVLGAGLWGLGNLLAGVGTARFGLPWLYATYGLIGGFGGGMAYVVPGANVTRWFPKHRGLVNGVVLLVFGLGSVAYNSIVGANRKFVAFADAAGRAVAARNAGISAGAPLPHASLQPPPGGSIITNILTWSGVCLIVLGVASALCLVTPPSDLAVPQTSDRHEYRWRETLRTRAFYALWGIVFVDCLSGLSLLGNAVPIYSQLSGVAAAGATIVYGWLSICNGIGRLMWAWISDSLGRIPALVGAFALQAASIFALSRAHAPLEVGVAFAVLLLCFGGVLGIAPALTADYFGTRYLGEDYGSIITAVSAAGIIGPVLFGVLEDLTGSLTGAIVPVAGLVAAAALLPLAARRPPKLPAS